ncbi:D-alanyl-D-alanine carboxypeptidase [Clostridium sp. SYSU_GA19001]|uniref:D-alanyl-D-alanine carboxypeptidase family protein n=1 Tax=Clostridium caldaquaticum TaxID=2940653 RepID=UPI0020775AFC|nr:D-alanyl-D-alanine carboxypeptidase family protein [Clostridium caldaquaticum]MCM8711067.1 D-alanyl-D-alanine carboxypeptidase [Clostridium caldaquaticum]
MKYRNFKKITYIMIAVFFSINILGLKAKAEEIYVNARCAVAIDSNTKIVLYDKNAHMLVPMASTTKIMTALVAIQYGDLDKKIEISSRAAGIRGSTVGYKKGEVVTLKELIYGLMLRSGNDAAIAIAEGIAGSVEEFVKLMNEYASQIGVYSTHFESPHGLDSQNHYSTAYDLAVITAKAREYQLFNEIVGSKDVDGAEKGFSRGFHNINKILWLLSNATGVKTGYTGQAGKCLVTSVDIDKNDIIIVVLNSPSRWKETEKINDYVAKNYRFKKYFSKNDIIDEVDIKGKREKIKLITNEDVVIPEKEGVNYEFKIVKPNYEIGDSVAKGAKLGSINVYADGKKIYTKYLEAYNSVEKKGLIKKWLFK